MAGLDANTPSPTSITVHQRSRVLEVGFSNGKTFRLPFELLRVYSPSAEVRGHGPGQEVLQVGKQDIDLLSIEPVGNYALQPTFSDQHSSGIYSWDYLYWLGDQQDKLWQDYLQRLAAAGASRAGDAADAAHAPPPASPPASAAAPAPGTGFKAVSRPK